MGFFDFFRMPDINQGLKDYNNAENAVLLDVRTPQEYREGHIPESKNVPLDNLSRVVQVVADKDTKVFLYCGSGSRSSQAARRLRQMGYTDVTNIGGIMTYSGKVER